MMTRFYYNALQRLEITDAALIDEWAKIEALLSNRAVLEPQYAACPRTLLDNIRREWRLVGGGGCGDVSALTDLMLDCIHRLLPLPADAPLTIRNAYDNICTTYGRRGPHLALSDLPSASVRYVTDHALQTALKRMVDEFSAHDFITKALPIEEAVKLVSSEWDASLFADSDMIANPNNKFVFATYDGDHLPSDAEAQLIAESLALPIAFPRPLAPADSHTYIPDPRNLCKLTYLTASLTNHGCPTFADAGTFPYFCSVNEPGDTDEQPITDQYRCFGMTKPLKEDQIPQPEYVHENASLRVLLQPIGYLGEVR